MRLYDSPPSGNSYKVRLLLAQLAIPYERVPVDIFKQQSRTPEFRKKNVSGRVPVLELDDGRFLAESAAILLYLAEGTALLPLDRYDRAQVNRWLFFEQNHVSPDIGGARYLTKFAKSGNPTDPLLIRLHKRGNDALSVMDQHLSEHLYFAADRYTVADIALYAYTHVAHEGGFDTGRYAAVERWQRRVEAQPRFVPMSK